MIENILEYKARNRTARDMLVSEVDLSGVDLCMLRAEGMKFEFATLLNANLSRTAWRSCHFCSVRLGGSDASGAVFLLSEFRDVKAEDLDFKGGRFENSKAISCTFDRADFSSASLADSDLSRSSFVQANLSNVDATATTFRGADLRQANLANANFTDADLRGADLSGACLEGTNFNGADMRGAIQAPKTEQTGETPKVEERQFSPEFEQLSETVAPLVASLLERGEGEQLLSGETQEKLFKELHAYTSAAKLSKKDREPMDRVIDLILRRAGKVGVGPLLTAMQQEQAEPTGAVADMLRGFINDFSLDDEATMEDVLKGLVKGVKTSGKVSPEQP